MEIYRRILSDEIAREENIHYLASMIQMITNGKSISEIVEAANKKSKSLPVSIEDVLRDWFYHGMKE